MSDRALKRRGVLVVLGVEPSDRPNGLFNMGRQERHGDVRVGHSVSSARDVGLARDRSNSITAGGTPDRRLLEWTRLRAGLFGMTGIVPRSVRKRRRPSLS